MCPFLTPCSPLHRCALKKRKAGKGRELIKIDYSKCQMECMGETIDLLKEDTRGSEGLPF